MTPGPIAKKWLKSFYLVEEHTVLPDGKAEIIPPNIYPSLFLFHRLDNPLRIQIGRRSVQTVRRPGFIFPISSHFYRIEHQGPLLGLILQIHPAYYRQILDQPVKGVGGRLLGLDQVSRIDVDLLMEIVCQDLPPEHWASQIELLTPEWLPLLSPPNRHIENAIQIIEQQNGQVGIKELADRIDLSGRHLNRLFREHFGLSPKMFIRLFRLEQVIAVLRSNPKISLYDLSDQFGFYDASHFYRDFLQLTSMSPTRFARHLREKNLHPEQLVILSA